MKITLISDLNVIAQNVFQNFNNKMYVYLRKKRTN